ncbi:MAG: glycosyltransferase [Holophagaceae bacterium]|uniref:Glycosyltransferase n=1 Tax=Candidatus Geothrix odensensis TaxID=2954440 RepID=A0A936EZX3_9BACT|nr:glycosyltransferase [Candidatus Geothrix odensensis]
MPAPFQLLMPSYNQAHFIGEAVESVLRQEDPDWELWIVDNSSDETPKVMAAFTDPRIHFIHEPRRMDPGTCLNLMLEKAKGRGRDFSYIHTDNRLLPCFVGDHRKALAGHPLSLAACDYWEMDEQGRRTKIRRRPEPFPLGRLFSVDSIGVPFAATLELAERLGGFSSDDLADDVLFVLRADAVGPRVHLHTPQMEYRVHRGSRFLSGGHLRVHRAIHKSVIKAYAERPAGVPDPFEGGLVRARDFTERAARMARTHLALGEKPEPGAWIEGTGPASFWLAWAFGNAGAPVAGFIGQEFESLLGVPVQPMAPEGARVVRPRLRGIAGLQQGVLWLLQGLPPLDHALKRLPGDVMAGLLVPFQLLEPGATRVKIRGEGPLAAYLAYAAEYLGALQVAGFAGPSPWPQLSSFSTEGSTTWDLDRPA